MTERQLKIAIESIIERYPALEEIPIKVIREWFIDSGFEQNQIYTICALAEGIAKSLLKDHKNLDS